MRDEYHDFLVNVGSPAALDATLSALPGVLAQVIGGPDGPFAEEDGHFIVRVFGNPSLFKFACEQQGYCEIVGQASSQESELFGTSPSDKSNVPNKDGES